MFCFRPNQSSSSFFAAVPALVIFAGVACTSAVADDQAKALLTESGAAIKALSGLTFTVQATTDGVGSMKLGGNATITLLRPANIAHTPGAPTAINLVTPTFTVDGNTEVAVDGAMRLRLTVVDNTTISYLDDKEKILHIKPANIKGEGDKFVNRARTVLFPPPLLEAEPFEKELRATKISVDEPKVIDGEPCDVVRISNDNKTEITIAIAQKDKLPRLYQTSRPISKDNALTRRWEISKVKVSPELTAVALTLKTPDGYKIQKEEPKPIATTPAAQRPIATQGGLAVGTAAPDFSLKLAGGGDLKLADQKDSVTVLTFWSPTVAASNEAARNVQKAMSGLDAKTHKAFAIACREGSDEEPRVQKFLGDNKISFRSAINGDETASAFNVRGFPSIVVLDKAGKVSGFFESVPSVDALRLAIETAAK